jgi:hypothetical protein
MLIWHVLHHKSPLGGFLCTLYLRGLPAILRQCKSTSNAGQRARHGQPAANEAGRAAHMRSFLSFSTPSFFTASNSCCIAKNLSSCMACVSQHSVDGHPQRAVPEIVAGHTYLVAAHRARHGIPLLRRPSGSFDGQSAVVRVHCRRMSVGIHKGHRDETRL